MTPEESGYFEATIAAGVQDCWNCGRARSVQEIGLFLDIPDDEGYIDNEPIETWFECLYCGAKDNA